MPLPEGETQYPLRVTQSAPRVNWGALDKMFGRPGPAPDVVPDDDHDDDDDDDDDDDAEAPNIPKRQKPDDDANDDDTLLLKHF